MNTKDTSYQALLSEIRNTLSSQFGIPQEQINADSQLIEDLDLDSIDMVDLLSIASDHYSVSLSPFDFEGCRTLDQFVTKLEALISKQATN